MTVAARPLTLLGNRRFWDDVRRLPKPIAAKVAAVVRLVSEHGTHYPSLHTRKVEGNSDGRFRFMNVDDQYRIVAVVEGDFVFFEKVGNHDETLKWGAQATLDEYESRLSLDELTPKEAPTATAPLFDQGLTLPQIVERAEEVSDLLAGDLIGALEGWHDGTIEDWMVFLSPVQRRAVDRVVTGPGRVTGGPGTGKTVVGLHRAAGFARGAARGERVLMTSFVRTIPPVLEGLLERLAPDVASRVDCKGIHQLAGSVLARSGARINVDGDNARRRFKGVLDGDRDRARQLRQVSRLSDDYLWDEITRVVEGRGIDSRGDYLRIDRHGRKRPLPAMTRQVVWSLYEDYRESCDSGDVADWDWLLRKALDAVRAEPVARPYVAIVVDEAQDITEVGLRFLLELLDGGPEGRLLVIGDSGQRIYPGGYRLSDLGLEIRGRSFPMSVCYRSTDEIMQAVGALGRFVSTDEFGDDGLRSLSTTTVRWGPKPTLRRFESADDERKAIIDELNPDDPELDGTAILVYSNKAAIEWRLVLAEAGIGSVRLEDYAGRSTPGVKVGTYNRSKGLEFARVYLPGLSAGFPFTSTDDPDQLIERASLLYVAMSRARDELHLSYVGRMAVILQEVAAYVEASATP